MYFFSKKKGILIKQTQFWNSKLDGNLFRDGFLCFFETSFNACCLVNVRKVKEISANIKPNIDHSTARHKIKKTNSKDGSDYVIKPNKYTEKCNSNILIWNEFTVPLKLKIRNRALPKTVLKIAKIHAHTNLNSSTFFVVSSQSVFRRTTAYDR